MRGESDNDRPVSRLVSATHRIPPVEVDCSDCDPEVATDPRPGSRLSNSARRVGAVTVDCSACEPDVPTGGQVPGEFENSAGRVTAPFADGSDGDRGQAVWLELRVPLEAADDPAAVAEAMVRLIRAADVAAPGLGLAYDAARSRVDIGEVVVALTPTSPVGAADRMAEIAGEIAAASHTTAVWRTAG